MNGDDQVMMAAKNLLAEHFDAVQIFATRYHPEKGALGCQDGFGSGYTRYGQVKLWLLKEEAMERNRDQSRMTDDE